AVKVTEPSPQTNRATRATAHTIAPIRRTMPTTARTVAGSTEVVRLTTVQSTSAYDARSSHRHWQSTKLTSALPYPWAVPDASQTTLLYQSLRVAILNLDLAPGQRLTER